MNKAILVGNLGSDPELRYTKNQKSVSSFSLATSYGYKDSSGDRKEITTWHKIVVWGNQAENCKKYLNKGSKVLIEGRITNETYEDKDGIKRSVTKIIADHVEFLSPKSENKKQELKEEDDIPEDELPF